MKVFIHYEEPAAEALHQTLKITLPKKWITGPVRNLIDTFLEVCDQPTNLPIFSPVCVACARHCRGYAHTTVACLVSCCRGRDPEHALIGFRHSRPGGAARPGRLGSARLARSTTLLLLHHHLLRDTTRGVRARSNTTRSTRRTRWRRARCPRRETSTARSTVTRGREEAMFVPLDDRPHVRAPLLPREGAPRERQPRGDPVRRARDRQALGPYRPLREGEGGGSSWWWWWCGPVRTERRGAADGRRSGRPHLRELLRGGNPPTADRADLDLNSNERHG